MQAIVGRAATWCNRRRGPGAVPGTDGGSTSPNPSEGRSSCFERIRDGKTVNVPSLALTADASGVAAARRFAHAQLAACPHETRERAGLVVSEMVTNALLHGNGPLDVSVEVRADHVRIAVGDHGSPLNGDRLAPRLPGGLAEGGRGLAIVALLASSWGVTPRPPGKVVWCELPLHSSPLTVRPETG